MKRLTVYQYPKCSTCRNALKWLKECGYEIDSIDVVSTPPSAADLERLIQLSGLETRKFFNTTGEAYKTMKLKDKLPHMSEREMVDLLAGNGRLIKRPIVTDGKKVTVGFKPSEFENIWK